MAGISVIVQQHNIEKASKSYNPLESFPECNEYISDDFEFNIYCKRKVDMDSKTLKWAFKLAEKNVGGYYKSCKLGWQPKIKQSDLNKNWARYLIAVDRKNKKPVAYAMFRFDLDYEISVLYCYEMHVDETLQRKGLGTHIMSCLEKIAKYWKMEKIVLTVLKNDQVALRFYYKNNYIVDSTSPDKEENADYDILSKIL